MSWLSQPAIAHRLVGYGESGLETPLLEPSVFMPRVLGNAQNQVKAPRHLEIVMTQLVPFNYPELFEKAVGVLLPLLDNSPKKPVSLLDLKMALSSYYEESCFRYAKNFMSMEKDHDWHWVKVDDYYQRSFNSPENIVRQTAGEAFGWVLQHLEKNRVFPTAAKRLENGGVELWVRAQRVATITRIAFASVPREQAQRVERVFKGVREHEEIPQLLKRLASIPGLQNAAYPTIPLPPPRKAPPC
jgi:hypothetical protein